MDSPFGVNEYWKMVSESLVLDCKQFKCRTEYEDPELLLEEFEADNGSRDADFGGAYPSGQVTLYQLSDTLANELLQLNDTLVSWFPFEDNINYTFKAKIMVLTPLKNTLILRFEAVEPSDNNYLKD